VDFREGFGEALPIEDSADLVISNGVLNLMPDEGLANGTAVMARAMSRWSYARKMTWQVPRIARRVPYFGEYPGQRVRPIAPTAG
jgi:hypothetical protein